MFNLILRPFFLVMQCAFSPDPKIRAMAPVSFALLIASLGGAVFTAYISQTEYANILSLGSSHWSAWALSIGIAAVMFCITSAIGTHIAERIKKVQVLIPSEIIFILLGLGLVIGIFDVQKNMDGSGEVAKKIHKELTLLEYERQQGELPEKGIYEAAKKSANDYFQANKVKERGEWVIDYRMRGEYKKKTEIADNALLAYQAAREALRPDYQKVNGDILAKQERAEKGMKSLSAFIYFIMVILAIPLGFFLVNIDAADGKYDGTYTPEPSRKKFWWKRSKAEPVIGFQRATEEDKLREELGKLRKEMDTIRKGENVTDHGGKGAKSEGLGIGKDSRFSSSYQPEKKRGGVYAERADSAESRAAILSAYRGISRNGEKPTYAKIGGITGLSVKTVGKYVRRMKREGVIS